MRILRYIVAIPITFIVIRFIHSFAADDIYNNLRLSEDVFWHKLIEIGVDCFVGFFANMGGFCLCGKIVPENSEKFIKVFSSIDIIIVIIAHIFLLGVAWNGNFLDFYITLSMILRTISIINGILVGVEFGKMKS